MLMIFIENMHYFARFFFENKNKFYTIKNFLNFIRKSHHDVETRPRHANYNNRVEGG